MIEVGMTVWTDVFAEPVYIKIDSVRDDGKGRLYISNDDEGVFMCFEYQLEICKVIDVGKCARCGKGHDELPFRPLNNHDDWSHWCLCPSVGQPILMKVE